MLLASRLTIYLIADFSARPEWLVYRVVEESLLAGVTALQYRDKSAAGPDARLDRALGLRRMAERHGALYIVNDDVELALTVGADGVHLGPHDMPPAEARARAGDALIIGGSAGEPERGRALERSGVEYLGVGAIFEARPTKENASAPRGPGVLTRMRAAVSIPVVAIGGIGPDNAVEAFRAGAQGVAVVRAVLDAEDPGAVVRALKGAARLAGVGEDTMGG